MGQQHHKNKIVYTQEIFLEFYSENNKTQFFQENLTFGCKRSIIDSNKNKVELEVLSHQSNKNYEQKNLHKTQNKKIINPL